MMSLSAVLAALLLAGEFRVAAGESASSMRLEPGGAAELTALDVEGRALEARGASWSIEESRLIVQPSDGPALSFDLADVDPERLLSGETLTVGLEVPVGGEPFRTSVRISRFPGRRGGIE